MSYQIKVLWGPEEITTLRDILPEKGSLKLLFIAKRPSPESVNIGHYFRGNQGLLFWKKLKEYGILQFEDDEYPDDNLLQAGYGIIDVVKKPGYFGDEPSMVDYKRGIPKLMKIIESLKPKILVFVYKKVLDQILKINYELENKSVYGFNSGLNALLNSHVFVFPMPGTPCKKEQGHLALVELQKLLKKIG